MRKFLIALIAVVTLGAGTAFAQSGYWAGFSVGYPGAALHFGLEDVTPNLSVRVNAGYNYIGSGFSVGVDGLYDLAVDTGTTPIDVYVGGGLGLGIGSGFDLAVNAFVGGEFRLVDAGLPQGGVFLEVGPSFQVIPAFRFGVIGRLGFNYHF
ncbi:MAG: hypothetical protein WDA03_04130 [Trueperaceae bacterium]